MLNKFVDKAHRSVVLEIIRRSEAFFISRVTTAFFKLVGTTPSDREQLTSLVIEGKRMSKHSLTKMEGHGANRQHCVGDFIIAF